MSAQAAPVTSTTPPIPTQLSRTPLVPDAVLKRHGAYCTVDTRFRAAARLLQCIWLRDQDIPTASSQNRTSADGAPAFGSVLSTEAANAGRNFLSSATYSLALQEWLLCEDDAAIDEVRLFGNALSSMPLVFNLFAPMALDLKLATAVFRALLPGFVQSVERIQFEHSPGRRDERFLADRTAFDLAVHVTTLEGERGTVFIEVKFSESMEGPAARMRDRYDEASREVHLYDNPDSLILRSIPIEQTWREHMLAQLAVDNGVTPRAVFMTIGPQLNRRVQGVFRVYQGELIAADQCEPNRVPFVPLTLESVIEAVAAAGASDFAHALWHRYCDFDRVYRLTMQELEGDTAVLSTVERHDAVRTADARAVPPTRRRAKSHREAPHSPPKNSTISKQAAR